MKLLDTWNERKPLLKHILSCIECITVEEAQQLITDEMECVIWRENITRMEKREYRQALYDASAFNYLREAVTRLKAADAGLDYKTMQDLVLSKRYPLTSVEDLESENKIVSSSSIFMLHRIWHDDLPGETMESEAAGLLYIEIRIGNGLTIRKGRTLVF